MKISWEAQISLIGATAILILLSWSSDSNAATYKSAATAQSACIATVGTAWHSWSGSNCPNQQTTIPGYSGAYGYYEAVGTSNGSRYLFATITAYNDAVATVHYSAGPGLVLFYFASGVCPAGTVEITGGECYTEPDPPGCEYEGQAYNSLTEACECPDGQSPGWAGTVGGGLTKQCVTDFPDEPEPCPVPIGYVNGQPYCPASDPEVCPAGHNEGYVNGELVCLPAPEPTDCPPGTTYEYRNGITQCWDDIPPVDPTDPTDPPEPGSPHHPDSPASNQQVQQVKDAIDAAKDEAVKTNSKLDTANNRLTSINNNIDKLVNTPSTMPTNTTGATVETVNTGYWDQLQAVPLVQAFASIANVVPEQGGSCSPLAFDLSATIIGKNISTQIHCDIAETVRPYLASIMMVVFVIFGIRHVASA